MSVFDRMRGIGKLTEKDVDAALNEVKMALLEADVNFKVVKGFIKRIKERALGAEILKSLTPGQQVIKIVHEELVVLLGSERSKITVSPKKPTIIMMAGLQGSGKTTTSAKLALNLRKEEKKKPLLVACDIYRPAAIKQLQVLGDQLGIEVFVGEEGQKPALIAKNAVKYALDNDLDTVIIDTAGRLHIDEDMMDELVAIRDNVDISQTILVVDAMTGQDAVNVASSFTEKVGIDGVILTKLDGDTRGGAALSIKAVTGKPILYAGMGEKLSDLEQFYPERMASRILGMGDVLSLIEKAEAAVDADEAKEMANKLKKAEFDFEDYLTSMQQVKKMGGMGSLLSMMPGLGGQMKGMDMPDEKALGRVEAIIYSMTPQERRKPDIINPSRKNRIARGAGVDISEVNRLIKQFEQTKKLMKQMGVMGGKKGKKRGMNMGNMMSMLGGRKGGKFPF